MGFSQVHRLTIVSMLTWQSSRVSILIGAIRSSTVSARYKSRQATPKIQNGNIQAAKPSSAKTSAQAKKSNPQPLVSKTAIYRNHTASRSNNTTPASSGGLHAGRSSSFYRVSPSPTPAREYRLVAGPPTTQDGQASSSATQRPLREQRNPSTTSDLETHRPCK